MYMYTSHFALFGSVCAGEQMWVKLNTDFRGGFSFRSQKIQLFLIVCFRSHQEGVGAVCCSEPGNRCCTVGRQSEGSAKRGVEDRTLLYHSLGVLGSLLSFMCACTIKPLVSNVLQPHNTRKNLFFIYV